MKRFILKQNKILSPNEVSKRNKVVRQPKGKIRFEFQNEDSNDLGTETKRLWLFNNRVEFVLVLFAKLGFLLSCVSPELIVHSCSFINIEMSLSPVSPSRIGNWL
jgi:hypothetical protein